MSSSCDLIRFAYRYNPWAKDVVLTRMEQLSAEQYTAPGCSGHGSIRDTFAHCISSTHVWFLWFLWFEGRNGTHHRTQIVAGIRRAGATRGTSKCSYTS